MFITMFSNCCLYVDALFDVVAVFCCLPFAFYNMFWRRRSCLFGLALVFRYFGRSFASLVLFMFARWSCLSACCCVLSRCYVCACSYVFWLCLLVCVYIACGFSLVAAWCCVCIFVLLACVVIYSVCVFYVCVIYNVEAAVNLHT